MAGDIQEPFRLSFQADSLHSGSISFGRFEKEALCWERRSSFSHNRYLEEVEKYSKPGSVTEKKAYFEAHFKRKALLSQNSLEGQNGNESQNSENEMSENMGSQEEFEHPDKSSHMTSYNESPTHSIEDKESQLTEFEADNAGTSYSIPPTEPSLCDTDAVSRISGHIMTEEVIQADAENLLLSNTEPENNAKENLNVDCGATSLDMSSKTISSSSGSTTCEKDYSVSSKHQQGPSSKVMIGSQIKLVKSSQLSVVQARKNIPSESSKDIGKKPTRRERDVSVRYKSERKSAEATTSALISVHQTRKDEVAHNSKGRVIHESTSCTEQESRTKKSVNSQPSTSEKISLRSSESASRHMRNGSSTKPFTKQNGSNFSFKSDERAERRKEFYLKLEEKMHAKEAAVQQLQVKKQEKTEADIKQLRKSLNFKATPMPSFYSETGHGLRKIKAVATSSKSRKVLNKSPSPRTRATEPMNPTNLLQVPELTSYPPVPTDGGPQSTGHASSYCHPKQAMLHKSPTGKDEHEKVKHPSAQKHRVSECSKGNRGQKVEGKDKVQAERIRNTTRRKDIKGVDVQSSARMSHLAVGVAS